MSFIAVEAAIAERLTAKLADLDPRPSVHRAYDLATAKARSHRDVSVYVAYNGIVEVGDPGRNVASIAWTDHEFLIWIVARSARDAASGAATREKADPVVDRVLESLLGWVVDGHPLRIATAPGPAYDEEGFGYFPLVFVQRRQVRGIK